MKSSEPPRPVASALQNWSTLSGTIRQLARRYQLIRILAGLSLGLLVLGTQHRLAGQAADLQAQWGQTRPVWVATGPVAAGEVLAATTVSEMAVPLRFVPDGPALTNPTGQRTRVRLSRGEIILSERLGLGPASASAVRTPSGWLTVALSDQGELFTIGDRVDLHDLADGARLATNAVIVDVAERHVGVAVTPDAVGNVIMALGRGGVIPVLRG